MCSSCFRAVKDLDAVYAPIGMGSGICGLISVRDLLGLQTHIIGVVADAAPAVALSFEQGRLLNTNAAATFADGMACRAPGRSPSTSSAAVRPAWSASRRTRSPKRSAPVHTDTHNLAEGAGAAPLAALLKERSSMQGKRIGLILSGGSIDREPFADVLAGNTPRP